MYSKWIEVENIKEEIERHEIISFDIWDTLIMRKTLVPEDVFGLVAKKADQCGIVIDDFKKYRIRSVLENRTPNPNIYEIYSCFKEMTGISDKDSQQLLQIELEIETKVTIPRQQMVEVLNYAKSVHKRIFLISDMYLPFDFVNKLLHNAGIFGYEKLFVSCEYRQLKIQKLFSIFKGEVVGSTYLHIGDNMESDIICATQNGITPFYIPSARDMLSESVYSEIIEKADGKNERSMVGLFIAKLFNSPFTDMTNIYKGSVEKYGDIGYLFVAPFITKFILWFIEQVKKTDCCDILFSARDGYFIQKLYCYAKEKLGLKNIPDGKYFYTSRAACTSIHVYDENSINWLLNVPYKEPVRDLLMNRFGLDEKELVDYDTKKDILTYLLEKKEKIYQVSTQRRLNFQKYMDRIGLKAEQKYIFYDFVSSGTSQYFLEKFVPYKLQGIYFLRSIVEHYDKLDIIGMLQNVGVRRADSYFYGHYKFMETFMTSPEPSVLMFDANGMPVFLPEERSEDQIQNIISMQESIERYFHDFIDLLYLEGETISIDLVEQLYRYSENLYTSYKNINLEETCLVDDWSGERTQLKYIMEKTGLELSEKEKNIENYINEIDNEQLEEVLKKDCSWEAFYHFSAMRSSIINWYEFRKSDRVMEIGGDMGAITGTLCSSCEYVVTVEKSIKKAELIRKRYSEKKNLEVHGGDWRKAAAGRKFDCIVIIGEFEWMGEGSSSLYVYASILRELMGYLTQDGKLLLAVENRKGIRYECGIPDSHTGKPYDGLNNYPDGTAGRSFDREELRKILKLAGVNQYKFYYPLPDYILTQEVYSENYLPKGRMRDRVIYYYLQPECLTASEEKEYEKAVKEDTFEEKTNSYLIECTVAGNFCTADYAALSTDRGKEHGFATTVHNMEYVRKKTLYKEGMPYLEKCYRNIDALIKRNISVVHHTLENSSLVMPYIKEQKFMDILGESGQKNQDEFLGFLDDFYDIILSSSEHVSPSENNIPGGADEDWGIILKEAYIDMIPLNCFYKESEICFFDQEFMVENYPAKYIMFRTVRYTYLSYPDIEKTTEIEAVKKRYGLDTVWQLCMEEEDRFVWENRRHEINNPFYKLTVKPSFD